MFLRERRWRMFAVEWVFDSLATLHIMGALVLVPFVQEEFQVSASYAAWVTIGYSVATAAFMLPAAFLGNSLGRKPVLLFALAVEGSVLVALFFAPTMLAVVALRVLGGITNAMVTSCMMAMVQGSFPPQERGKTLGLMATGPGTAVLLSTLVGGFISDHLGWRYLFLFIAPNYLLFGFLAVLFIFRDLPGARAQRPPLWRFDYLGVVGIATGLAAFILSLQMFRARADLLPAAALLAVAVVAIGLFLLNERRSPYPLIRLELFKNRTFSLGSSLTLIFSGVHGALSFLFTIYLIQGAGWSGTLAGAVLTLVNAGRPAISPISGWLADLIGSRPLIVAAVLTTTLGGLVGLLLGSDPPVALAAVALLLVGVGFGFFFAPNQKLVYVTVPQQLLSLAPGVLLLGNHGGRAIGITLAASLLAALGGEAALVRAFTVSTAIITVGFFACAALAFLAFGRTGEAGPAAVPAPAGHSQPKG